MTVQILTGLILQTALTPMKLLKLPILRYR